MRTIRLAVSPCPNDTYIYAAWVLGFLSAMEREHFAGACFTWADVEELNFFASNKTHDVIKVSAAHALRLGRDFEILSSGAAFGLGAGPKLAVMDTELPMVRRIAVPGLNTTAFILLKSALKAPFEACPMRFDLIVDAVRNKEVDAGLLIHETALVCERYGLRVALDLGAWWDEHTGGLPLPLGCVIADKSLGGESVMAVDSIIKASIERAGVDDAREVMPLVRAFAREMDEQVLRAHIRAYVNEMSGDMGGKGREALHRLSEMMQFLG